MEMLEKMGFSNVFTDMIWRLVAKNWYSILINREVHVFFHSSRGVTQWGPLSPSLFIIIAEVITGHLIIYSHMMISGVMD